MAETTCENYGQNLKSLLECLVSQQGVAVAEFVQGKIDALVSVHGVDIEALQNAIAAINAELDADDSLVAGILNQLAELQTAVQNNTVSINAANTAITDAVNSFNTAISEERTYVDNQIQNILNQLHDAYDDSEVRALIQANVEAISGERQERIDAILAVEALVAKNSSDIVELKAGLEANAAAIATNASGLAALTTVVNTLRTELEAQIAGVAACLDKVVSALDLVSCEGLTNSFKAGLAAGGSSSGL